MSLIGMKIVQLYRNYRARPAEKPRGRPVGPREAAAVSRGATRLLAGAGLIAGSEGMVFQ
jgi:hypothetical protein